MLKTLKKKIKKFASLAVKKRSGQAVVTHRHDHCISRSLIDDDALKVMYRLKQADFTAYLVGGGVRDLLLGRKPKDFDVATDARPRQIKRLFRNCFLVGRRFRLAHIRFGDKIIETSTFRREPPHSPPLLEGDKAGLRKRTNTFGTPEEDALMRDFTINGLFYDIRTFSVIDHVGGQGDLDKGLIRCIGDPRIRFCEDPVRMMRAVRFASRLNFTIEKKTYRGIVRHHREIAHCPPPRLLEEIYRLFGFETGQAAFRLLAETKLLGAILPAVDAYLAGTRAGDLSLWKCLEALDRQEPDGSVPRESAIFCALFYPLFDSKVRQMEAGPHSANHQQTAREFLVECAGSLPIPKRIMDRLVRAFDAQRRFEPSGRRFSRKRFVLQDTFPDALLLREIVLRARGDDLGSLAPWRKLRKEFLAENSGVETPPETAGPDGEPKRAPRRRRRIRRRRKPNQPSPAADPKPGETGGGT